MTDTSRASRSPARFASRTAASATRSPANGSGGASTAATTLDKAKLPGAVAAALTAYEQAVAAARTCYSGKGVVGVDDVSGLGLPADVEARFVEMTPATYVGIAPQLVDFLEV